VEPIPSMPVFRANGGRVAFLADVQSLFYAAKNAQQSKVEYGRMLAGVVGNRFLTRAIAYVVQREQSSTGFCDALMRFGYDIRLKSLPARLEGENQPKWTWVAGICVDAMNLAPRVDTIVIATADATLVPLVESLVGVGCRVEIAGVERGTPSELVRCASAFIPIRADWMFKEPKFTSADATPIRRNPRYEGLPDDAELDIEAEALANRQQGTGY
jgi:uncharacterized LabA/DUF88 family protein